MDYEWDEAKSASNRKKHGIGFEEIHEFNWGLATGLETLIVDNERRYLCVGPIGTKLYAVVTADRNQAVRIISLREADNGEIQEWRAEFQR